MKSVRSGARQIGNRLDLDRHDSADVILDANGPVAGLTGIFSRARGRKYFKGPRRPRLADLTDTELVLYGP